MTNQLFSKPKLLSEFLEICSKNKYFAATIENNRIRNVKFLKNAPNLQANIERQWLFKSKDIDNSLKTYNNDEFLEYGDSLTLLEKYAVIRKRDRLARSIPFGLIECENHHEAIVFGSEQLDDTAIAIQLENYPKLLNCWYLVNDKQSQEYFYRIQRFRKIWWMKVTSILLIVFFFFSSH